MYTMTVVPSIILKCPLDERNFLKYTKMRFCIKLCERNVITHKIQIQSSRVTSYIIYNERYTNGTYRKNRKVKM